MIFLIRADKLHLKKIPAEVFSRFILNRIVETEMR